MKWPWSVKPAASDARTVEARKGASDALRAAQGQSSDVARVTHAAARAVWRAERLAREIERALHKGGAAT